MSNKLTRNEIWAEMARRKVYFHNQEDWDKISLWGLFEWQDVSPLLKTGELITTMRKENHIIWVTPSKEAWETKIKPLIEQHTLEELTTLSGW